MKQSKIHSVADLSSVMIVLVCLLLCWLTQSGRDHFIRYASILVFCALVILFFNHINWRKRLKEHDVELYMVIGASILSVVNMIIVRSRIGAIFTIVDFLLLLYLVNKVDLNPVCFKLITFTCIFISLYWFLIKRTTYVSCDFNTNIGAAIIFTSTLMGLCGINYLKPQLFDNKYKWNIFISTIFFLLFIQVLLLRARGTLLAILIVIITYYWIHCDVKLVRCILLFSFLFPFLYTALWKIGFNFQLPLLNKPFFSGREKIWAEFLSAYFIHPLTGIGSDFQRMVPNALYYDIHHALLDLLIVHGLPVFIITIYLFIKRLTGLFADSTQNFKNRLYLSAICSILLTGAYEIYYISSPYNMFLFLIMLIIYQNNRTKEIKTCT